VIACSGTFTVTLPDAAAVGSGFAVAIGNYGTGTVTVDTFSTQTIDGATTKTLATNTMLVACAVAGEWLTVGGVTLPAASTSTAGIVQLSTSTTSTSTTLAATPSAVKAAYDLAAGKAEASHTHAYVPTNAAFGSVGSFCSVSWPVTVSNQEGGTTIAGSSLRSGDASGPALSGTWQLHGRVPSGTVGTRVITVAQRIS
jgi:phage-related tail fiber protein